MALSNELHERLNKESGLTARRTVGLTLIIGIIFIAANLRTPLSSVGPLVGLIRSSTQISNTMAGMITTLPLLAFALFSTWVPRLGRKFGVERLIMAAVVCLTFGIVLRSVPGVITLYAGTIVLGLAIAVCNVMLPSLIKHEFPSRLGMMTGVYSISMNLMSAIASGISIPLAVNAGLGWRGALGIWGVLSFISIVMWLPQWKRKGKENGASTIQNNTVAGEQTSLWRSGLAWQVTLYMGLQSMVFYVVIAWLPEILLQQGIGSGQSGWLLSILQLAMLPFTFIVPVMAGRMSNQRPLIIMAFIFIMSGILGLLYGSVHLIALWVILVGIGCSFAFGLAMMFFGLRTKDAHQAAELSGMAQSVGYLLAATGPMLFGYLHDVTHSWTTPLLILVGATVLLLIFGLGAARDRKISS
ncbi:transporter [Bacillus sp. FJAT-27264]|uniref:CynX/NimT family MFS transporter n=1 Tax=Paenibacillus sp. (strain DSM 101736 / FJAT-27264) TaxID=1850362 RepID=UPI0008081767|nr:MFS transporter [Bacillus sp. FJAT-27264]OBZ14723.1 transporter [Bacillus sp. FJAT-27264]